MAKEVISRCDVCGTNEEVEEFKIERKGVAKLVDLCVEHGKPVVEVFELGATGTKVPARRGRPSSHSVVPIEDWKPDGDQ